MNVRPSLTQNDPAGPAVLEPVKVKVPETVEKPRVTPLYRVLIHNDDVTPMDFVVHVLKEIFKKGGFEASRIMITAHFKGVCLVVVLPLEEAELRVDQAHSMARARSFPLTFSIEPEG